jgi:hypothetical protein
MGHHHPATIHSALQERQHLHRENLQALRAYASAFPCFPTPLTSLVYPDLKDFAPQLKVFYNKQLYAGSWDGVDVHGGARELMRMDLSSMPYKVREWMKRETNQKHYSVQDDNVFFAPGAIYPILPLWVDDADEAGVECEDVFDDLENYSNEPRDGAIVGKVTHSEAGKGEVQFTVEALVVKKKGKAPTRKEEL